MKVGALSPAWTKMRANSKSCPSARTCPDDLILPIHGNHGHLHRSGNIQLGQQSPGAVIGRMATKLTFSAYCRFTGVTLSSAQYPAWAAEYIVGWQGLTPGITPDRAHNAAQGMAGTEMRVCSRDGRSWRFPVSTP